MAMESLVESSRNNHTDLNQNRPEEAETLLQKCLNGTTKEQYFALFRLNELRWLQAIPMALTLLQSNNADVRSMAVNMLGQLGTSTMDEVGQALVAKLTDSEEDVRISAIEALGNLPYPLAVTKIADLLLNDPDDMVRVFAAETLGYLGDPSVLPSLFQSLDDPFYLVVRYALSSIGLLGNQETLMLLQPYKIRYEQDAESIDLLSTYFIACYRLGDRTSVKLMTQHLLEDRTVNDNTAGIIMNKIDFLVTYHCPKDLDQDGIQFIPVLQKWEERFPRKNGPLPERLIKRLEQLHEDTTGSQKT